MNESELLHIVCPHCLSTNRVPAARVDQSPACGRCHKALFSAHAMPVDAAGFERMLGDTDLPVLVDFWAPWCGPCLAMAPQLDAAAARLEPRVRVIKIDIQAHPEIAQRFNVQSIPMLGLFGGGRELARHSGAIGAQQIVNWAVPRIMAS
jgi:thioredoxin 2